MFDEKPASVWDKLPERSRPFTWATPAPMPDGTVPAPWRVAHRKEVESWLKGLSVPGVDPSGIYTDYESEMLKGRLQIHVGLRDNRDPVAHSAKLQDLLQYLKQRMYPVQGVTYNGRLIALKLVDDLAKDVLRGKTATFRREVIRCAYQNPEMRPHLLALLKD